MNNKQGEGEIADSNIQNTKWTLEVPSVKTISQTNEIKVALRKAFRLTPLWYSRFESHWLKWAISIGITAEDIEDTATVWYGDKRFSWKVPTLKDIYEHWFELSSLESFCWAKLENHFRSKGMKNPISREMFFDAFRQALKNARRDGVNLSWLKWSEDENE